MPDRLVLRRHAQAARVARERAHLLTGLRGALDGQGFVEATPPVLLPTAGSEPHLHPPAVRVEGLPGPLWLQTSPEVPLRRLVAAGLPQVYALGPAFRGGREELSEHHQPGFTLLEWYRPGTSVDDLVQDCVRLGRAAAEALERPPAAGQPLVVSVAEACARWANVDIGALLEGDREGFAASLRAAGLAPGDGDDEVLLFSRLVVERLDPALSRVPGWVFLHDWPRCVAALAATSPDDPRMAQRVEAYLDGVELANGYVELTDPAELAARWRADGERREGSAPPQDTALLEELAAGHGAATVGMALGVDRLHMLATGARRLADVLPLWLDLEGSGPA